MPRAALVFIQVASILGCLLTAGRLSVGGLAGKYRFFFGYLVFWAIYGSSLLFLDIKSDWYEYVYVTGRPIAWIFYFGTVLELYRLVLIRHRGFYTIGRWAMYAGMAIATLVSALALLPKITPLMPQTTRILWYVSAGDRAVAFSLAIFLLLMLAFLNFYTVPLTRNIVVHTVLYTIFFLSSTLRMILWSVFGRRLATETDTVLTAAAFGCLMAWFFLLKPKGEESRLRQPWFGPEREERILHQLDAINASLLRVGRQ